MLEVENINFNYKNKQLLKNINFKVNNGEMRVLVGPNGAGKTTLLKTILNIYKKTSGNICLNGKNISSLKSKEFSHLVAYMPQFNEIPNLTVLEVLELGRYTYSGSVINKANREIINKIIEDFSLEKILHKGILNLSGGQRQKVFLASCLVQEPKMLILDEPISHLDPKNQLDVLRIIKKITVKNNIITLIVLHDMQHALHYGDKLLMMKNASVLYDIETTEIKEKHLNDLFDVHAKLFKQEHHTFVYYEHSHKNSNNELHSH